MNYFLVALFLGLDFLSKWAVSHWMVFPFGGLPIFSDLLGISFSLCCVHNTGMAWGLFSGFSGLLFTFRVFIIGALCFYLYSRKSKTIEIRALWLIVAGAIGNAMDYLIYGSVVDFLHFNFWGYSFPVFNFADSYITIGAILLFLFKKEIASS